MSETDFEHLTTCLAVGGLLLMGVVFATALTHNEALGYLSAAGVGAIAYPLYRWYRTALTGR